jgi:hypothetical protein
VEAERLASHQHAAAADRLALMAAATSRTGLDFAS